MGKVLRYILNHKKRMLKIALVIVCVIVLIIFAASQYVITIDDGVYDDDKIANVPSTVKSRIDESALFGYADDAVDLKTKPSVSGGYAIDVNLDELVDTIITDLNKYEGRLNIYLSKGKVHEYLKKMIKAEFITQYPDLRRKDKIGTEVSGDEFQGVIQFNRHKSDGTEQILEYMPLGEKDAVNGNTLYGLINQANGEGGVSESVIKSARDKILNYFSVDAHGNLIIVNWSKIITKNITGEYETEYPGRDAQIDYSDKDRQFINNVEEEIEYKYFTHIINYRSSISKYTMPFNYLWAFLVCGRDEEFISDFADIVLDSKIVISVYDNLTEIEETKIDAYNDSLWKQTRTSKRTLVDGKVTDSSQGEWSTPKRESTIHKYDINYIKTYTNAIVVAVTDLNIWYMDYSVTYTYEVVDEGEEKQIEYLEPIDNEKVLVEGDWETVDRTEEALEYDEAGNVIKSKVTEKQEKIDIMTQHVYTQRTFTSFYHMIQYKYTLNGDPVVKEKTDPKLKEGDEGYPNFCTLYIKSQCALANITGVESWLFTIIEKNSDTVNMLELTKYLLYCATGIKFGVTSFDLGEIYPMQPVDDLGGGGIGGPGDFVGIGGSVEEQVWFALINTGYSPEAAAGVLGNLQRESGIRTNNLQNTYEGILGMSDEQYTTAVDSGAYSATKFSKDSAGYGIAQWTSSGRKEGLYRFAKTVKSASISDASVQILYLLGEISQTGGADGCATFQMGGSYQGYTYSSWSNAKTPEDAAVAFCKVFERAGTEALADRKKYAREFYEKYRNYTQSGRYIGNIELTGEEKQKMYSMLNEAIRIANDDRYGYSQDRRDEEFYYDCSSFVYRLYTKYFNINVPNGTAQYYSYEQYKVGPASRVVLKPGDVLWRRKGSEGHVTIYLGNGNYVAARGVKGKTKAQQISVYQDSPSKYTYVYRFIGK